MGIRYRCDRDRKLALIVWSGSVSMSEWESHLRRMLPDPEFLATECQLSDMRFAEVDPAIGRDDMTRMVEFLEKYRDRFSNRKVAIVAPREFDRVRLFERLAGSLGVNFIAFVDLDAACTWLGMDAAVVEKQIQELSGPEAG